MAHASDLIFWFGLLVGMLLGFIVGYFGGNMLRRRRRNW